MQDMQNTIVEPNRDAPNSYTTHDVCAHQNLNLLALAVAEALCEGKSKCEIEKLLHFLQLVSCNAKTYVK